MTSQGISIPADSFWTEREEAESLASDDSGPFMEIELKILDRSKVCNRILFQQFFQVLAIISVIGKFVIIVNISLGLKGAAPYCAHVCRERWP